MSALSELTAWQLAGYADCAQPDRLDSKGAAFLLSVRDAVVEAIEEGACDQDRVSEIADQAPDVYTYTLWQEFVDLAAYQEDPTELGCDGSDMEQSARVCLYMIAERLAGALLEEAGIER